MLMMSARIATCRLKMRDDIALSEDRQALHKLRRQIAAAGPDQCCVELAITDGDLPQLGSCRAVEPLKRIEHVRAIIVRRHGRCERRCVRLDLEAKIVDLVELTSRHRPDDVAAVRLAGEQPVLLEARQGFA